MTTFKEIQKREDEWLKEFQTQSDQSSIRGSVIESLLEALRKTKTQRDKKKILENVRKLSGTGEITLKKEDKKVIIKLINYELIQIKKDIQKLKVIKKISR